MVYNHTTDMQLTDANNKCFYFLVHNTRNETHLANTVNWIKEFGSTQQVDKQINNIDDGM